VVIVAGKDYGAGSSRDWAAKGPKLLGVRCGRPRPPPGRRPRRRDHLLGAGAARHHEADYYRHGGVLPYVLRTVLDPGRTPPAT
jgi:Aconitase C-terminal domain